MNRCRNLHPHTPQDPYILCLTASPANPSYALQIRKGQLKLPESSGGISPVRISDFPISCENRTESTRCASGVGHTTVSRRLRSSDLTRTRRRGASGPVPDRSFCGAKRGAGIGGYGAQVRVVVELGISSVFGSTASLANARLTADTTARRDAVVIEPARPTPQ